MKRLNISMAIPLIIFLITVTHWSVAQEQSFDSFDAYANKALETFGVPGLAVGIIKGDKVVFSRGYGVRNSNTGEPVNSETVFCIASCTKAFTAAAVCKLVDEKRLSWSDKAEDIVPFFKLHDPWVSSVITVEDLLSHRSGLRTFDGDLLWYGTDYSREEVITRIQHLPLRQAFRSEFGYQNVMYVAAGEVVEEISGMSWDNYLRKEIFNPLGMDETSTSSFGLENRDNVAWPHIGGKPMEFMDYDNSGPAASMSSNINDLLNWVGMWINNGEWRGSKLLSANLINHLTTSKTPVNYRINNKKLGTHFYSYGLGWFLMDYAGCKVVEHGGGLPGFHSKVAWIPDEEIGFVILTNQISGLVNAVYYRLLDELLGVGETDHIQKYHERDKQYAKMLADKKFEREKQRKENTEPSFQLSSYSGMYIDKMYGKARVDYNDGDLTLALLPTSGLFTSKMSHWHLNTFRIEFNDPFLPEGFVTFHIDSSGSIDHFTIDLPNPDFHFYNLKFVKTETNQ